MHQHLRSAAASFDARFPLALKLAVPMLLLGSVGIIAISAIIYRFESHRIRSDFEGRAILLAAAIEQDMAREELVGGDDMLASALQSHVDSFAQVDESIVLYNAYAVIDGVSVIVASTDVDIVRGAGDAQEDVEADTRALFAADIFTDEETIGGQQVMEVGVPLKLSGLPPLGMGLYMSTAERDQKIAALLRVVVFSGGAALLAMLSAFLLGLRVLINARLRPVMLATERMQGGDYTARVGGMHPPGARDELLRLGSQFNAMAESIETLQESLVKQATIDELTGLYNRRYVIQALEREIVQSRRNQRLPGVIIFDLDGLKDINDLYGHGAGDEALCNVAKVMQESVRAGEVAARFGGDEYVVMLPECDREALLSVMERIRSGVEELGSTWMVKGQQKRLTVSAGGALLQDRDTSDTLLERADIALFQAKRAGRNQAQLAA